MKHKKIFRMLAVALTLALLLVAIPAIPVSAAISVNVDPDEGEIGDNIRIYGSGFVGVEYFFYFSSQEAEVDEYINEQVTVYEFLINSTAQPDINVTTLYVPADLDEGPGDTEIVHGGRYYIYMARKNDKIVDRTTFYVTGVAEITDFDPDEGTVGTEVEIRGKGFAPGETIVVEYDGDEIEIDSGDEKIDEDGMFVLTIIIPESEFDEHTITIKGEDSLAELEETFTVESEISINPTSGEAGTIVTVTGTGFDRRNGVDFSFGGTPVTNVVWLVESGGRTNSDGTFAVQLSVPLNTVPGSYTILAEDEDDDDIFA